MRTYPLYPYQTISPGPGRRDSLTEVFGGTMPALPPSPQR